MGLSIEREKVVKGLECCSFLTANTCMECPYGNVCGSAECAQMAKDALELLKGQNWTSVKDRLPNCNGCYLVWRPHFYPDKGMPSICYFDGQNTWHDSYGVDFTRVLAPDDVSHWMPLPEQP